MQGICANTSILINTINMVYNGIHCIQTVPLSVCRAPATTYINRKTIFIFFYSLIRLPLKFALSMVNCAITSKRNRRQLFLGNKTLFMWTRNCVNKIRFTFESEFIQFFGCLDRNQTRFRRISWILHAYCTGIERCADILYVHWFIWSGHDVKAA